MKLLSAIISVLALSSANASEKKDDRPIQAPSCVPGMPDHLQPDPRCRLNK